MALIEATSSVQGHDLFFFWVGKWTGWSKDGEIVTTVPLSVCYWGAKPLGLWVQTSNFVPCE